GGRGAPPPAEPQDEEREDPDPAGGRGLHKRERPERQRPDVESPAADSDRETRDPATVREQQAKRAQGSANAEDRESRRLRVLDEIAPVEGQGRAGRQRERGSGRAADRRCPTSGR